MLAVTFCKSSSRRVFLELLEKMARVSVKRRMLDGGRRRTEVKYTSLDSIRVRNGGGSGSVDYNCA